jgi:ubiquitin C-terminal hydrolase
MEEETDLGPEKGLKKLNEFLSDEKRETIKQRLMSNDRLAELIFILHLNDLAEQRPEDDLAEKLFGLKMDLLEKSNQPVIQEKDGAGVQKEQQFVDKRTIDQLFEDIGYLNNQEEYRMLIGRLHGNLNQEKSPSKRSLMEQRLQELEEKYGFKPS